MNNITKPSSESNNFNPHRTLKEIIIQERIRQARLSFDVALIATALSFVVSLIGSGYLMTGQVSEGAVTSAVGLVASIRYLGLAKDANNRLDNILDELDTN